MALRLSALRAGSPLPRGRFLVFISVRGWVDPRTIVRLGGSGQLKNSMTSSGIDPATFRLVALVYLTGIQSQVSEVYTRKNRWKRHPYYAFFSTKRDLKFLSGAPLACWTLTKMLHNKSILTCLHRCTCVNIGLIDNRSWVKVTHTRTHTHCQQDAISFTDNI
jgi:hypothetical protein